MKADLSAVMQWRQIKAKVKAEIKTKTKDKIKAKTCLL